MLRRDSDIASAPRAPGRAAVASYELLPPGEVGSPPQHVGGQVAEEVVRRGLGAERHPVAARRRTLAYARGRAMRVSVQ